VGLPTHAEVLEVARMFPIEDYLNKRRNNLVEAIATQPILDVCLMSQGVSTLVGSGLGVEM